jgi:hypothetical protein
VLAHNAALLAESDGLRLKLSELERKHEDLVAATKAATTAAYAASPSSSSEQRPLTPAPPPPPPPPKVLAKAAAPAAAAAATAAAVTFKSTLKNDKAKTRSLAAPTATTALATAGNGGGGTGGGSNANGGNGDGKCGSWLKVFVYEFPPELPFNKLAAEYKEDCRQPKGKCDSQYGGENLLAQFSLELILHDFFLQSCVRTLNPEEAHLFFVPFHNDVEYRATGRPHDASKHGQALLDILEMGAVNGW